MTKTQRLAVLLTVVNLLVLASPVVVVPAVRAQSPPQPPTPVHLEVIADGPLQDRVTGCLVEALRAFPEVELSDAAAALTLSVIFVEQKMSDGQMIGYLVYEGGYQPAPQCPGGGELDPSVRPVVVYWQMLRMLPPDFRKACRHIAADFKAEVVDSTRKLQRAIVNPEGAR